MPQTVDMSLGATYKQVSISFVDASGDRRSISNKIRADATVNDVENAVQALAAASNANIYKVKISDVWAATPKGSDAINGVKSNSVWDNVVISYATPDGQSQRGYIPAPREGNFVGVTDNINTAAVMFGNVRDGVEAILPAAYEPASTRFTERRETNQAQAAE